MRLGCVCWRFGDEIGLVCNYTHTRHRFVSRTKLRYKTTEAAVCAPLQHCSFAPCLHPKISPLDVFAHSTLRTFLPVRGSGNSFGKQKRRNEVDTTNDNVEEAIDCQKANPPTKDLLKSIHSSNSQNKQEATGPASQQ